MLLPDILDCAEEQQRQAQYGAVLVLIGWLTQIKEKWMKQIIFCIAAVITYAVVSSDGGRAMAAPAEEQTWTGQISDSMCGAKHKPSAEHGAGKQMTDRECTLACVKDHGAKYVFVSGGKVYTVGNQDMAALQEHAGHTVRLTGVMTGGDTISVSKIVMPAGKAK